MWGGMRAAVASSQRAQGGWGALSSSSLLLSSSASGGHREIDMLLGCALLYPLGSCKKSEAWPCHSCSASCVGFCCSALQPCAPAMSKTLKVLKWRCPFSTMLAVVRGARVPCVRAAGPPSQYD